MANLVSTDWLAAHLGADELVVLDASQHLPDAKRDARAEFEEAHIPGARFLDLASLVDETSEVPKALPRADQYIERLGQLGVTRDSRVILYDDSTIKSSARAWFILKMFDFGDCSVLDGGFAKWRAEGREIETGHLAADSCEFSAPAPKGEVRTKAQMLANCTSGAEQIVDARDAARFEGSAQSDPHGQEGGHIPGSRNLPFTYLFEDDGTFKGPDEIRGEFESAGIDLDKPIVASCGSGMTASVLLLALALAGKDDGALYDGSWLEWGSDPETPKETGAAG